MTIKQIDSATSKVSLSAASMSPAGGACSAIQTLTAQLTRSLRRPTRRTFTLIDKALSYLTPFESPLARAASASERTDLLALLSSHSILLSPYLDIDRVERHLRRSA